MATLKGQNFRVLVLNALTSKYHVIGMSTNCTVTLNTNVDDGGTKDDTGMAAKPTVVSKSWQVQVDSLNVADVGQLLTAMKSQAPFFLIWDEVSVTDNQTPINEGEAQYGGKAFLTDVTFNFNNRENSAASLQFVGAAELIDNAQVDTEIVAAGSYTKGQFVRLFLSSDNTATPAAVVAAARQLSLHVSLTVEDSSTKDTPGDWVANESTALNYDISTTALMRSNDTITSLVGGKSLSDLESIYLNATPVKWQIANVSGDNNRTKGSVICSGSCIVQTLTLNGPNRNNATYTASLAGFGPYTVGA